MSDLFDLPFEEEEPPEEPEPAARPASPDTRRASGPVRQVLSVTELTLRIRDLLELELGSIWVEGELSNCRVWNTGHLYFTLKDGSSQVRGFMFRSALRYLKFKPADGLHVIARGKLTVYEPKGDYQLLCEHLEPAGLGALQLAFDQLKKRLDADGLFSAARKRPLPVLPRKIGIVTSLEGAAIRDIIKVLRRRYGNAHLVVRPARVQGEGAALDLARGLSAVARVTGVDVIIIGRGGGSIEDLWAFNEEIVARAIARSPVPVISAVGHETDVTIADFVADVRAPTPSAAAELVVSRKDEFCSRIDRLQGRLSAAVGGRLQAFGRRLHYADGRPAFAGFSARLAMRARHLTELSHGLARVLHASVEHRARRVQHIERRLLALDAGRRLAAIRTRLVAAQGRLVHGVVRCRDSARARLGSATGRLESLSPLGVMARGYSVCWNSDRTRALRDAAEAQSGDRVRVTLSRGELECEVRETKDSP